MYFLLECFHTIHYSKQATGANNSNVYIRGNKISAMSNNEMYDGLEYKAISNSVNFNHDEDPMFMDIDCTVHVIYVCPPWLVIRLQP